MTAEMPPRLFLLVLDKSDQSCARAFIPDSILHGAGRDDPVVSEPKDVGSLLRLLSIVGFLLGRRVGDVGRFQPRTL